MALAILARVSRDVQGYNVQSCPWINADSEGPSPRGNFIRRRSKKETLNLESDDKFRGGPSLDPQPSGLGAPGLDWDDNEFDINL